MSAGFLRHCIYVQGTTPRNDATVRGGHKFHRSCSRGESAARVPCKKFQANLREFSRRQLASPMKGGIPLVPAGLPACREGDYDTREAPRRSRGSSSMLRLVTISAAALTASLFATAATAQLQVCPVSRMITASGTEMPGMPPHIYYIYPESGEIQEGLNEPHPAPINC